MPGDVLMHARRRTNACQETCKCNREQETIDTDANREQELREAVKGLAMSMAQVTSHTNACNETY
jgi:hypothetical protein